MAAAARDNGVVPDESFDAQVQEQEGRIVVTLRGERTHLRGDGMDSCDGTD